MRFQRDAYSCGVFAILNGAEALGVRLSERAVRAHTGTTKDGTTQHGILNALERLDFKSTVIEIPNKVTACKTVWAEVGDGKVVLLCVEESNHWVSTMGVCGKRLSTFDSWNSKYCKSVGGVDVWDPRSLCRWWTKQDGKYFGIVMERRK